MQSEDRLRIRTFRSLVIGESKATNIFNSIESQPRSVKKLQAFSTFAR